MSIEFYDAGGKKPLPGTIVSLGPGAGKTNLMAARYAEKMRLMWRQRKTLQRLIDAIVWLDRDEDIGPYLDDHGFRLPDEE